ncbi:hypothetical protein ACS0TY_003116 [Phlomoides rotata]
MAVGGVARDCRGVVRWCFASVVDVEAEVDLVEARAAYKGLLLARENYESRVMLETDSQRLYYALTRSKTDFSRFGEVCDEILALRSLFSYFSVSWCHRIGNSVAHCLASFAFSIEDSYSSTSVPACCLNALKVDALA